MPIAAAVPAIAGLAGGLLGGIGGATNTRPPSLDPTQRGTLDSLIKNLYGGLQTTPSIDPVQQKAMFNQIDASGVGGANRATANLASRGLGRSGLLAQALNQNNAQTSSNQNTANLQLQQQAVTQRNTTIQQILGLLGVGNIPGQSGVGGFFSGAAGPLAYGLGKMNFGGLQQSANTPGLD